jgi:hypothetical protein
VLVRASHHLNNVVEQNHRAIKRRCASMAGFKSFATAAVTIAGIELAHRIRKRRFMLSRTYRRLGKWSLKKEWAIALALSVTGSRMESRAPKIRRCTRTLALVTGHMQMVAAGNIPPFPSVHVSDKVQLHYPEHIGHGSRACK